MILIVRLGTEVLAIYTVFHGEKLSLVSGELPTGTIISLQSYVLGSPFCKIVCKVVEKKRQG
jgi:hypothetical protein